MFPTISPIKIASVVILLGEVLNLLEQGPTSHELGFTEPVVKITLTNNGRNDIQIKDILLMYPSYL